MYLDPTRKLFHYYKSLADKSIEQVPEAALHLKINDHGNSIAILVKHMAGNMISRFTDFRTTDGEKPWRNRETEFEDTFQSKEEMMAYWKKGWAVLFNAIDPLEKEDLSSVIYIRNEGHNILEALQRQLGHYAYHVGQIVFLSKIILEQDWNYLSIPPGQSEQFFQAKMAKDKSRLFFTDGQDEA